MYWALSKERESCPDVSASISSWMMHTWYPLSDMTLKRHTRESTLTVHCWELEESNSNSRQYSKPISWSYPYAPSFLSSLLKWATLQTWPYTTNLGKLIRSHFTGFITTVLQRIICARLTELFQNRTHFLLGIVARWVYCIFCCAFGMQRTSRLNTKTKRGSLLKSTRLRN